MNREFKIKKPNFKKHLKNKKSFPTKKPKKNLK